MQDKKYRVAVYCRVANADQLSTDPQAIEQQRDCLIRYAADNGFDIEALNIYMDNGYNGLNFGRPAFAQMEADIQAGRVGAVIVKDISRIGRNYIDVVCWLDKLRAKKVAFIESNLSFGENYLRNRGFLKKFIDERYGV